MQGKQVTIILPTSVFRRAKAAAALSGVSLKEFVSELLDANSPEQTLTKQEKGRTSKGAPAV